MPSGNPIIIINYFTYGKVLHNNVTIKESTVPNNVKYCYTLQAWIVDGIVSTCGHSVKDTGCHSCMNHGTPHTNCDSCNAIEGSAKAYENAAIERMLNAQRNMKGRG